MGRTIKIISYLILVFLLAMAGLSIFVGSPEIGLILAAALYIVALFAYPKIFDKMYEQGGIKSLYLSSIEMATIGAIIGSFFISSMGLIALLLGALGILLVIQAHEIGHFVFCHKYKLDPVSLPIRKIFSIGFGITLSAVVHKRAQTRMQDATIALAGPMVNLLLFGIFLALLPSFSNSNLLPFFTFLKDANWYFFVVNIAFEGIPVVLKFLLPSHH